MRKVRGSRAASVAFRGKGRIRSGRASAGSTAIRRKPRRRTSLSARSSTVSDAVIRAAMSAGSQDGASWRRSLQTRASPDAYRLAVQGSWNRFAERHQLHRRANWSKVHQIAKKYAASFAGETAMPHRVVPVPMKGTAAAVVCAHRPSFALEHVLSQLDALPLHEIIVVLGERAVPQFDPIRQSHPVVIVAVPEELDPDVGRALGAKLTEADCVLFVDAESPVDAEELARFLWTCDGRADIALDDSPSQNLAFARRGGVQWIHEFLNATLNRADLKSSSLANVPFAMSRRALETIGPSSLVVPAKAHVLAIMNGLKAVNVPTSGSASPKTDQEDRKKAAGDALEAWREVLNMRGSRLHFVDKTRNRGVLGGLEI